MLNALNLKEKQSPFHKYVQEHLSIAQMATPEETKKYNDTYKLWQHQFNYSHGDLDTQRKLDLKKINTTFNLNIKDKDDVFRFIFAIDSFYLCLLTLCAARKLDDDFCHSKLDEYLDFSFFKHLKIGNYFLPSDTYLGYSIPSVQLSLVSLAQSLASVDFLEDNHDVIREVFHEIYPREVRHSLGEFYTPDWMAQHIVEGYEFNNSNEVIVDPTCGSGTFLITALKKLNANYPEDNNIQKLMGFDINPISSFAAKTNIILNSHKKTITGQIIPIFNSNMLDCEIKSCKFENFAEAISTIISVTSHSSKTYSSADIQNLENISKEIPYLAKQRASIAIGNPPWVNWEYLPTDYREKYKHVWQEYGLFDYKGMNSIFIKEDISSLITYVTINHYLKNNGRISFVVKESLFKSVKQAAGFRKFHISNSETPFKINLLEDLTAFNPFNGVSNSTVIFHATKGQETIYPVDYSIWTVKKRQKLLDTESFSSAASKISTENKLAVPSNPDDMTSGWASLCNDLYKNLDKLTGVSSYKARTGVFTGGANGIYWLDILEKTNGSLCKIRNITERAKIKFEKITTEVERDHLYPYASGSDIRMWSFAYKKYIVCPHTAETKMYPIPIEKLRESTPSTAKYFEHFENELRQRKGFTSFDKKIHEEHFFTLQRIGDYTFAKYKVAWKYISSEFTCAVITDANDKFVGRKNVIPNEKIIYIGLNDKKEAYYLCGLLSSTYFRGLINSFKVSTQIAPGTIKNLNLPEFNPNNESHMRISHLCEQGHSDTDNIKEYIAKIDDLLLLAIGEKEKNGKTQMKMVALPASTANQESFAFE
ncbi:MAG: N-6 DNA methylase [Pseudomonadaceae bacterium]|nr:N-6 DNA methylase [Pseudomonadaceae bacterium]